LDTDAQQNECGKSHQHPSTVGAKLGDDALSEAEAHVTAMAGMRATAAPASSAR
jgi:hypothetical protein